ncbi:MAG: dihydrolipoamide acetyltransferase [bacterium]|nr:dihydrolipoamide acetyltransferase [Myxococcales bacterium]
MHPRPRSAIALSLLWASLAAADPPADPAAHRRRITEIEQRVAALKEEVFRHKSRLAALEETVLQSEIAAASARIVHRNEMGSSFRLEHVSYRLDGELIFERTDATGALDDETEIELWRDAIVPGDHTLAVVMVYRGDGFGVFSYLQSYVFTLRSSHTFHVDAGEQITVEIVGYEDGGVATDLTERPKVRFDDTLQSPTRPGGG